MPIPTRSAREPSSATEAKSKIPSTRAHQRTASTVLPAAAHPIAKTHQRAVSSIPQQVKVGSTEQSTSSLRRQLSTAVTPSINAQQLSLTGRTVSKPSSTPLTSAKKDGSKAVAAPKQPIVKPQFNTYQQRFSPKKPLRPASTVSDTPSSNENSTAAHDGPDILRLREELFQLQLMHVGSKKVLNEFELTSQMRLKSKFDILKQRSDSLQALERQRKQCINYAALKNWLNRNGEITGDKLQLLGTSIRDLDGLTVKDGRLSRAVSQFHTWFEDMILALDSRKTSSRSTAESLLFVEPINNSWATEMATIQRKLQSSRQILYDLSDVDGKTEDIHHVLASYKSLADNLLEELETCISIHKILLEQQHSWVEAASEALINGRFSESSEESIAAREVFGKVRLQINVNALDSIAS